MVSQRQERLSTTQVSTTQTPDKLVIEASQFQQLLNIISSKGYEVIGPTVRDGTIVYDHIASVTDLPVGYAAEQSGGTYRLKQTSDCTFFGYGIGPLSWKNFLYPSAIRLWQAQRQQLGFKVVPENDKPPKYAFIGVRACELAAIAIQDKVLLKGDYIDPIYQSRRRNNFIVAVNCSTAAEACFCTSMKTGPKATGEFDLSLTEIVQDQRHFFVAEVGTQEGADVIGELTCQNASIDDKVAADAVINNTKASIHRHLNTTDLPELLARNTENPQWENVASRCLSCGNCTMVCPTCFCTTIEDVTDLAGQNAERWRKWDSCFSLDFSYIHGGSVRSSVKSRYRQWLTHKLSSWVDQFGTFGCVGCGRCITWCPVGIDLIQEIDAIRENSPSIQTPVSGEK